MTDTMANIAVLGASTIRQGTLTLPSKSYLKAVIKIFFLFI